MIFIRSIKRDAAPENANRLKMPLERPWMSEPGLPVGRKGHQPSGSLHPAKNQSRERQQLRRLDPSRQLAQSFAAPERIAGHRFAVDYSAGVVTPLSRRCQLPKSL